MIESLILAGRAVQRNLGLWIILCELVTLLVLFLTASEMQRIEAGQLFIFSLPWDAPPSLHEQIDARSTARTFFGPSVALIALLGSVFACAAPRILKRRKALPRARVLYMAFAVAVVADLVTTLWFFHTCGIDFELHPGIRLFAYGYGRTTGAAIGKFVQVAGVLAISAIFPRAAKMLLIAATAIYGAAAAYNIIGTVKWLLMQ